MGNQFIIRVLVLAVTEKAGTELIQPVWPFPGCDRQLQGPRQWSWPGPALIRRLFGRTSAVSWLLWPAWDSIFSRPFSIPTAEDRLVKTKPEIRRWFHWLYLGSAAVTRRDPMPPVGGPADHSLDFAKTKDHTKVCIYNQFAKTQSVQTPGKQGRLECAMTFCWRGCVRTALSQSSVAAAQSLRDEGRAAVGWLNWFNAAPPRLAGRGRRLPGDRVKDVFIIFDQVQYPLRRRREEDHSDATILSLPTAGTPAHFSFSRGTAVLAWLFCVAGF